jgi:hypothetical protein
MEPVVSHLDSAPAIKQGKDVGTNQARHLRVQPSTSTLRVPLGFGQSTPTSESLSRPDLGALAPHLAPGTDAPGRPVELTPSMVVVLWEEDVH